MAQVPKPASRRKTADTGAGLVAFSCSKRCKRCCKAGFLRLQQGKCGLLALDVLGKLRHDLRLAGLLALASLDLLPGLGELTVRAFGPLPVW